MKFVFFIGIFSLSAIHASVVEKCEKAKIAFNTLKLKQLQLLKEEESVDELSRGIELSEQRSIVLNNLLQQTNELLSIGDVHASPDAEQEIAIMIRDALIDQQPASGLADLCQYTEFALEQVGKAGLVRVLSGLIDVEKIESTNAKFAFSELQNSLTNLRVEIDFLTASVPQDLDKCINHLTRSIRGTEAQLNSLRGSIELLNRRGREIKAAIDLMVPVMYRPLGPGETVSEPANWLHMFHFATVISRLLYRNEQFVPWEEELRIEEYRLALIEGIENTVHSVVQGQTLAFCLYRDLGVALEAALCHPRYMEQTLISKLNSLNALKNDVSENFIKKL